MATTMNDSIGTIKVRKTERGFPGFIEDIRAALQSGKQIRFDGLTTLSEDQTGPAWELLRQLGGYYDSSGSRMRQRGVEQIKIPRGEIGISGFVRNMKNALSARNRVELIGWGDESGNRDDDQTILARRIINKEQPRAEMGDTAGVLRVIPDLDYHDWQGWVDARARGNTLLALDGTDITDIISLAATHQGIHPPEIISIEEMTRKFINRMKDGKLPEWARPWTDAILMRPRNPHRRRYGFNAFHLAQTAEERGFGSPVWVTRTWAEKNGHPVMRGERGVGLFSAFENEYGEIIFAWQNTVFNLWQCRGIEKRGVERETLDLPKAETIIEEYPKRENLKVQTAYLEDRAFYGMYLTGSHPPSFDDRVVVPPRSRFPDESQYFVTMFHEFAHSTKHPSRLDRPSHEERGDPIYSFEELIAQMTASLLAVETGLEFKGDWVENSARYLQGWVMKLENDPSILWKAMPKAQRAFDYILNRDDAVAKAHKRAEEKYGVNSAWE